MPRAPRRITIIRGPSFEVSTAHRAPTLLGATEGPIRVSKRIPAFLVLAGIALTALALGADALGVGSHPGIGPTQRVLGLLGVACIGVAAALRTPKGERLLLRLDDRSPAALRFSEAAALLIGFALIGGLCDTGLLRLQNALGHGFDYVPRGHIWMTALSFLIILSIPTLVGWLLGRFVLGWFGSERVMVTGLTTIVVLGVASNYHPELAIWAILLLSGGVTVQTWRFVTEHRGRVVRVARRAARPLIALVVGLAAISALAPRFGERLASSRLPDARPEARNIVLIILDTVRARNMSLYGYERATTPYLDRLAASSTVFDRAYSPSSWTLPTHASIFTGLQPHDLSANWITPLDDDAPTLAEVFVSRGYRTAGFVANQNYAGPQTGLDRGFSHYDARHLHSRTVLGASMLGRLLLLGGWEAWSWPDLQRKPGRAVTGQFLDWLPESDDRPFFAFLNYFDAHDPYDPPDPFADHFANDTPPVRPVHGPRRPHLQAAIRGYDASIAALDEEVRRLMSGLSRRGLLESTVIVVTSDHGEEFAEKGMMTHGNNLNASVLHVPLLVVLPDRQVGTRVPRPVSLRDLAVTLLELSRSDEGETAVLPGRSLVPDLYGPGSRARSDGSRTDTVLAELTGFRSDEPGTPRFEGYLVSAITDTLHYVVDGAGAEDLFALEADPWELESLAERPRYGDDLRALREWVRPAARKWRVRTVRPPPETRPFPGRRVEESDEWRDRSPAVRPARMLPRVEPSGDRQGRRSSTPYRAQARTSPRFRTMRRPTDGPSASSRRAKSSS